LISELLDTLPGGEHVEVIIARLPEWTLAPLQGHVKLRGLNGLCEDGPLRLAD
jgi:hypothetical protein